MQHSIIHMAVYFVHIYFFDIIMLFTLSASKGSDVKFSPRSYPLQVKYISW